MSKVLRKLAAFPGKFLYRAPRAFLLKATRNSPARFDALIGGQSVAIVGNARSLLDANLGPQIDAHNVVIRLNKGFPTRPAAQGTRTDAIGLTPELSEEETITGFAPRMLLFLIPRLRHYRVYQRENVAKTVFYPFRYWLADQRLIGRRPSSGFMAISYVRRIGSAKSLTLYGFDFGQTPTYYNPDGYKTPHDFAREGAIIQGWAADGDLAIIRSDQTT